MNLNFQGIRVNPGVVLAIIIWGAAAAWGLWMLTDYEKTPGLAVQAPSRWPGDAGLLPAAEGWTLVLFLHPHCPCSRATLNELIKLITDYPGKVSVRLFFLRPGIFGEAWSRTDLWSAAEKIPGAMLYPDEDGAMAKRFGAVTSGQALLYDSKGVLQFQGGITAARGHVGANAGRFSIGTILNRLEPVTRRTPVYGCPLFDKRTAVS